MISIWAVLFLLLLSAAHALPAVRESVRFEEARTLARTLEESQVLEVPLVRRPRTVGGNAEDTRRLEGFKEITSIHREPDGVFWSNIKIGTPAQSFSVIVDTGSSTIAVPCKGCSCGAHNHFDVSVSKGAEELSTSYSQCYSEGSCNRVKYVRAKMCLGDDCEPETEGVSHEFGCCSKFAGAFQRQEADGIIGMSGGYGTLIQDLREHHKLESDMFSLCLADDVGILGVGGFEPSRHMEPIQWTPMRMREFYYVSVTGAYIGGKKTSAMGFPDPFVDSGTTFTYVPDGQLQIMAEAFDEWCSAENGRCPGERNTVEANSMDRHDSMACYKPPQQVLDSKDDMDFTNWLEKFPSIEFEYPGMDGKPVRLCVPSFSYFFKSSETAYCVGLLKGQGKFVLGAITMSGFDYVFDHQGQRLGMARSLCGKKAMGDSTYRTSAANCCGTCRAAQDDGYNGFASASKAPTTQNPTTAQPTMQPTTSFPTKSPTSAVAPTNQTTADGLFRFGAPHPSFRNHTLLIPIVDKPWASAKRTFSSNEVLFIKDLAQGATLCDSAFAGEQLSFEIGSVVLLTGHDSFLELGSGCTFSTLVVEQGASVYTQSNASPNVTIAANLTLDRAMFTVRSGATLSLLSGAQVQSSLTSNLVIQDKANLVCGRLAQEGGITLRSGLHSVHAPAHLQCFITVGEFATLRFFPAQESEYPSPTLSDYSLLIQGTLEMVLNKSPFRSFSLLMHSTLIWDKSFKRTVQKVAFDEEEELEGELPHDLPEIARLLTVSYGGVQDSPDVWLLGADLQCSGAHMQPASCEQLFLGTLTCLSKCMDDKGDQHCTPEEMEFTPWPPHKAVSVVVDETTLSKYYSSLLTSVGFKADTNTRRSVAGGWMAGSLVGLVVFLVFHPPALLKRVCCCKKLTKYDRL